MTNCPLCCQAEATRFWSDAHRDYWRCAVCRLIFVPRAQHLSREAEQERYRQHRNDPADADYRAFLDRLLQPLVPRLVAGTEGLDYGSGPGPTTSVMLAERDFRVTNYDPFFAPQSEALQRQYDFITCTETVEHFARPAEEFAQLAALLRPGGWLGVMTQMVESDEAFPAWWCHRDPTHVCFYGAAAMQWIARRHGWRIESPAANVVLFQDGGGAVDSSCAIRVT